MEKQKNLKKSFSILMFLLLTGIFLASCGANMPKPLSDSDKQKLQNAIKFDDTFMEEGSIGGEVTFDPGEVKINKNATDLVFVLSTDDSKENIGCKTGTEIGSVKNGSLAGRVGSITDGTAYVEDSFIMLCLRNAKFDKKDGDGNPLPNTIYSGLKSAKIVDNFNEPEPEPEPVVEEEVVVETDTVVEVYLPTFKNTLFAFDKYNVSPDQEQMILEKLGEIDDLSIIRVIVEGHTDERGSNEYNLALGERRAEAVKRILIRNGVAAEKINTVSYGEENPVDYAKTEAAYAKNRRAVIIAGADIN